MSKLQYEKLCKNRAKVNFNASKGFYSSIQHRPSGFLTAVRISDKIGKNTCIAQFEADLGRPRKISPWARGYAAEKVT